MVVSGATSSQISRSSAAGMAVSVLSVWKLITSPVAGLRLLIGGKPGRASFNIKVFNATDSDFSNMMCLLEPIEGVVLLAMPNHHSNVCGAARIKPNGLDCRVVAIAKHETEVEEMLKIEIPSLNL